ncbi:hypothetical protein Anas_06484, partial [Armadillidium nasatum]
NVYNSIGRPKSFYVRVPVEDSLNYTVQDQRGNFLESQVVPLPVQILNLPGRTSNLGYDLVFYAENIPALGALQYLVEVDSEDSSRKRSSVQSRKMETLIGKDTVVENKKLKLTLDGNTNKLKSFGIKIENNVRSELLGKLECPLVEEIHQEWASWVTQIIRTYQDKDYIEIEWLVGPIPISDSVGKEIVNVLEWGDFATDDTFYTDANGREMIKRVKDYRETWDLSLETESVSRNYYPVTAKFILHSVNGQGSAALLNDRGQKSGLAAPLPDNIHLLTLEPWSSSGTWLLRLENFYESLFSDWTVSNIRELVLGANAYKEDVVRYQWNVESEEIIHKAKEEKKIKASEAVYSFSPMQIRTFLVDVTQN